MKAALLGGGEVEPGDVGGDAGGPGGALHLAVDLGGTCVRGPGGDGALVEGLRFVRDDEVRVEVDGVAEALAAGQAPKGLLKEKRRGSGSR